MDFDEATAQALTQEQSVENDVLYRTARASQLRRRPALRSTERESGASLLRDPATDAPDEVIAKSALPTNLRAFEIRCGSGLSQSTGILIHKPYPLPLLPSSLKRKYSDSFQPATQGAASNGCGELLDSKAYPLPTLGAWSSVQPLHIAVLDDHYASGLTAEENIRNLGALFCGCVRQLFGCTTCGNIVGTVVRLCNAHHASSPMSSRDYPVRQGVYLFFPTRVTPYPDHPFPTSTSSARATRPDGGANPRLPAIRRRRTGRPTDDSTIFVDATRDSTPRVQRFSDIYEDFYYNHSNSQPDPPHTVRRRINLGPPPDDDDPDGNDEGSIGSWLAMHAERQAPARDQRPRSPSIVSGASEEIASGESLFPFPRAMSSSRDRSNAFTFVSNSESNNSGDRFLWATEDQEPGSSSAARREGSRSGSGSGGGRGGSSSLYEELTTLRRQHVQNLSSSTPTAFIRRRTGDEASTPSLPPVHPSGSPRTSIRSLINQPTPPPAPFTNPRRRRSSSFDAILEQRSPSVASGRSEDPVGLNDGSITLPPLTSLPMMRRRMRRTESVPRVPTPPLNAEPAPASTSDASETPITATAFQRTSSTDWTILEHAEEASAEDRSRRPQDRSVTADNESRDELDTSADAEVPSVLVGGIDCDSEIA